MIRFRCQKCKQNLSVADDQAGKLGSCPKCNQRFRIPAPPPTNTQPEKKSALSFPPGQPSAPEEEEQDTKPPSRQRRPEREIAEEDDDFDGEEEPRARRRRKKQRRREEGVFSQFDGFWKAMVGLGIAWLLLLILTFIFPLSGFLTLFLGIIILTAGGIWLLVEGFRENPLWGVGMLLGGMLVSVPFLIFHWGRGARPFFLSLAGSIFFSTGLLPLLLVVKPTIQEAQRKGRDAFASMDAQKNLQTLANAMHEYHDNHRGFPPFANHDQQGRPLLSWRVHLLPFLKEEALYKQFRLDEPWDSEHNKKMIPFMPWVYQRWPGLNQLGKTCYVVPRGKNTMFSGPKGSSLGRIMDGASNTILLLETNETQAVIWTKPEDFSVDSFPDPLGSLLEPDRADCPVVFADGSLDKLPRGLPVKIVQALFTANGGEIVNRP